MNCPNHADRPVVDPLVCTKQLCAQCLQELAERWADAWDYKAPGHNYKCILYADGRIEQVRI